MRDVARSGYKPVSSRSAARFRSSRCSSVKQTRSPPHHPSSGTSEALSSAERCGCGRGVSTAGREPTTSRSAATLAGGGDRRRERAAGQAGPHPPTAGWRAAAGTKEAKARTPPRNLRAWRQRSRRRRRAAKRRLHPLLPAAAGANDAASVPRTPTTTEAKPQRSHTRVISRLQIILASCLKRNRKSQETLFPSSRKGKSS